METTISDLLDVIHLTIIKAKGENQIILTQLKEIEAKMESGELPNLVVDNCSFFKSIVNNSGVNFHKKS